MNTLLYLVGAPGVGKSTVMAALTAGCDRLHSNHPFAHDVLFLPRDGDRNCDVAVELGARRDTFPGTDTLSMSVQPTAVRWIAARPHRLVLGEGARLGTTGFLRAAADAGYAVALVHLGATAEQLRDRRAQRAGTQSDTWAKGAATRAARLVGRMEFDTRVSILWLATTGSPQQTAARITAQYPALEALRP